MNEDSLYVGVLKFCFNNYKNKIHSTLVVSSVSEIMSYDIVTITIDSMKTAKDVADIIIKKKS
jgi:hypothetical protein